MRDNKSMRSNVESRPVQIFYCLMTNVLVCIPITRQSNATERRLFAGEHLESASGRPIFGGAQIVATCKLPLSWSSRAQRSIINLSRHIFELIYQQLQLIFKRDNYVQ